MAAAVPNTWFSPESLELRRKVERGSELLSHTRAILLLAIEALERNPSVEGHQIQALYAANETAGLAMDAIDAVEFL